MQRHMLSKNGVTDVTKQHQGETGTWESLFRQEPQSPLLGSIEVAVGDWLYDLRPCVDPNRHRLNRYLAQRVPGLSLAGSFRNCLIRAVLKCRFPRRTKVPVKLRYPFSRCRPNHDPITFADGRPEGQRVARGLFVTPRGRRPPRGDEVAAAAATLLDWRFNARKCKVKPFRASQSRSETFPCTGYKAFALKGQVLRGNLVARIGIWAH